MKKSVLILVLIMSAMIMNAQTRTVVKSADLPKAITENIAKDYAGFTIKDAVRVLSNNVMTYEVVIVKGTASNTLLYDKDGKFEKKLIAKAGTPANKEAASSMHKPVKK